MPSFFDGTTTQQALVLTCIGWIGMLLFTFQPESLYRRWHALEFLAALFGVAAIGACTVLLGMAPHSDAALLGGASLMIGALGVRVVRRVVRPASQHAV